MDRTDRILLVVVAIALVAAVFLAVGRARIEGANRAVEIVIDADDARVVARASGVSLPVLLDRLRQAGATSLAVREMTVGELREQGRVMMMSGPGETTFITPDSGLAGLLAEGLTDRLSGLPIDLASPPPIITVQAPPTALVDVPVMLRPEDVAAADAVDLRVVARPRNYPGATPEAVRSAIKRAAEAGARLIVFDRDEVLGYDRLLPEVASAFRKEGLLFGYVEMAEQRGDAALLSALSADVIRVHSISESDMLTMQPAVAVPRYARATAERNIRALYVRLLVRPGPDASAANVSYVEALTRAVRAKGLATGQARPWNAPRGWPPRGPRLLVGLGVVAGLLLLLRRFAPLPAVWSWLLFALVAVLGAAVSLVQPALAARLASLGAAIAFPTLATVWAVLGLRGAGRHWGAGRLLGVAVGRLALASAVSLVGAAMIVGLNARVGHLVGVAPFVGVKIALAVPLALVFIAAAADLAGSIEPWALWGTRLRVRLRQFFAQPVTLLLAGIVLASMGGLVFALTRSGNAPALAPSGLEIKMRSVLETVLAVRPRTKEFLLGHPALMLGAALALRGRRTWLPLVAIVAALGQASLLNTFCHFHTPLLISLARTANGLWIGAVVGAVTLLLWRWLFDRARVAQP